MFDSPLRTFEEKLGASFGEFGGWNMPMTFSSYQQEHLAVRRSMAVFDISHMGRLKVRAKFPEINYLVSGDLNSPPGKMVGPTAFLNERAGFKDDVMLYRAGDEEWLVVTNAINREKVMKWIRDNSSSEVEDLTFNMAMIAVQGPSASAFAEGIDHMSFRKNTTFLGEEVYLLSRSGWTGEDGVEVWARPEVAERIFQRVVSMGATPAGLVTRDSIRQEMGYVLYGEDIDETINPIQARYWVFSWDKDFLGREALREVVRSGVDKLRVGLKLGKGERLIPRAGSPIKIFGEEVGKVTSGTFSPYLNRSIGMGYVNPNRAPIGIKATVAIRNREYSIKISDFPLIR